MAQQGARVRKVEPPEGDRARLLGAVAAPGFSSAHVALNADKQSVAIDLARADGQALLRRMVPQADLLIHNFRPGVMERLGLGTDVLHALRPDPVSYTHLDVYKRQVWVSMAKAMIPERVCQIIDQAIQIHGATGISHWTPLAEPVSYTHLVTHVAPSFSLRGGTREILRGIIARGMGLR